MKTTTQSILEEKLAAGESFTVWDITRATRVRLGKGTPVPHGDVRTLVEEYYNGGRMPDAYTRTLANFPSTVIGNDPQPQVYHVVGADLSAYGLGAATPPLPAYIVGANTPSPGAGATQVVTATPLKPDARGSVSIPARMVKKLGWKAGDRVWVHQTQSGNFVINNDVQLAPGSVTDYRVNKHHNIRVTRKVVQGRALQAQEASDHVILY